MNIQKLLKKESQFLALTSLYVLEFEELLIPFSRRWQVFFKYFDLRSNRRKKPLTALQMENSTSKLSSDEDKLFFILYFFKNNHLQQSLGAQFDINQGHVSRWIKVLLPVLEQSIKDLHLQPARTMDELIYLFRSRQSSSDKAPHQKVESLHLDATERFMERNQDYSAQKHDFSGKKHGHTLKNSVICDEFQFIHFAGFTHRGAIHDKAMIEEEVPHFKALEDQFIWFTKDKGYQSYFPQGVFVLQPNKATRGHPLTGLEKLENSWISSIRIVCEHAISGVKRCRILKDTLRYFDSTFRDQIFYLACGLHNLRVSYRKFNYAIGASRVRARMNLNFL
jgi:DDE superfamily endonuclease